MANVKVVVPLLNKRKFPVESTTDKSNIVGQVRSGFQFESVAEVTNALGNWYQDRDGYYYWGGGVKMIINYNKLLQNIPDNIRKTKGENVTIAIIDSGCADIYNDLNVQIKARYDAYEPLTNSIDTSINSHGTFIAGLLTANNEVEGVCCKSRLIIIRVVDSAVDKVVAIKNGLSWLLDNYKNEVDIISMSLGFEPGAVYSKEIGDILDKFNQQTFFVAASGDNNELFEENICYPARLDLFTGVGEINPNILHDDSFDHINTKTRYLFPEFDYKSYSKSNILINDHGSSFATAIISGILSLIISEFKISGRNYTKADVLNACDQIAGKINSDEFKNINFKPYIL